MPSRAKVVLTIATRDLLERYVDEEYLARHRFHPKMEDFYITRIEDFRASISLPTQPHRRHVNVFVFLTAGEMTVTCDLERIRIGTDEAHLALASQVAIVENMSEDIRGFYCHFSAETILQLYHKEQMAAELMALSHGMRAEAVELRGSRRNGVTAILERLLDEHAGANNLRLIDAYLIALCHELKAAADTNATQQTAPRAHEVTEAFQQLLQRHVRENQPASFYAAQLGVTPNHLNKCVRAVSGESASALIAQARVHEAKVLLRHTALSVAEVAYQLGFEDPSYFSRAFRARVGKAPGAYRDGKD